ncbi:LOW QUALITY PROTEIN: hypothetical protein ElyMa_003978000 [Elysia marginata]|uniref:Uncharacterized protein n=1 Tax=Elysia marginata TaxID=1093978 RepID=A0AAV4FZP4_9GAST|nr:LOW QUALITY PROTEIN: hypothetical protein ElyMa_003978000 [Elysia marginata]
MVEAVALRGKVVDQAMSSMPPNANFFSALLFPDGLPSQSVVTSATTRQAEFPSAETDDVNTKETSPLGPYRLRACRLRLNKAGVDCNILVVDRVGDVVAVSFTSHDVCDDYNDDDGDECDDDDEDKTFLWWIASVTSSRLE